MSALFGIGLGLLIGIGCRVLDLPLPAPPKLTGALLVVVMTAGFIAAGTVTVELAPDELDVAPGPGHAEAAIAPALR